MILGKRSEFMLKISKTKSKLIEYEISKENYPNFPLNSDDLIYSTIYILSKYSESIINGNNEDEKIYYDELKKTSQFFDTYTKYNNVEYEYEFVISGASAYFLSDNFGSAKVLINSISYEIISNKIAMYIYVILNYILNNKVIHCDYNNDDISNILNSFFKHFKNGEPIGELINLLTKYKNNIYSSDSIKDVFYFDILIACVIKAINNSSWILLPLMSEIDISLWKKYLLNKNSIKMLWTSQYLISNSFIFKGSNGLIQLPTGVGKTKSIELIIRSAFLSNRTNIALIVAPLRSLCNEINNDLSASFFKEAIISQFSDVLQEDFIFNIEDEKKHIIICTPEKLNYIMHHEKDILKKIGLIIFDEGHMFDDVSRGADYELLITLIKNKMSLTAQIIVISAVLKNSNQINEWLFDNNGVVISSDKIKTTDKSIGFISSIEETIYYYDEKDLNKYDYFLPKSIQVSKLNKIGGERTERNFPEKNSRDLALYFGIKLCKNGGVAIYVNKIPTIKTVLHRLIDLEDRGYKLNNIIESSNENEIYKIVNLIKEHYGEDYYITKSALLGIFPHYKHLPNGIKLSVEYAMKKDYIKFVVCTSTLAQGVNIPIKYLFVTSCNNNQSRIAVRDFQNLIGRTARSGIYTEGSIIITDPLLFDNKERGRGYYNWQNNISLFNPNNSEKCGSSILNILDDIKINYKYTIRGEYVYNYIINYYDKDEDCFKNLYNNIVKSINLELSSNEYNSIFSQIIEKENNINSIEKFLCFEFDGKSEEEYNNISNEVCTSTLAYYLADENKKKIILDIFNIITKKIITKKVEKLSFYTKTFIGIDKANLLIDWYYSLDKSINEYNDDEVYDSIINLYLLMYDFHDNDISKISEITKMWINGIPFFEIENKLNDVEYNCMKIEKICSKIISYEFSFIVGNIIDLLKFKDEDEYIIFRFSKLQKQLKYGVKDITDISLCEIGFDDRILSQKITKILEDINLTSIEVPVYLSKNYFKVKELLEAYPTYFAKKLEKYNEYI
jgi:superfamily II DNA/RNA helicase